MEDDKTLKVLLVAPYFDQGSTGESWSTFKWVEGISKSCEVTVLTTHKKGWDAGDSLPDTCKIVNWDDVRLPEKLNYIDREMKPGYVVFYRRVRAWIRSALAGGEHFDLAHQINPLALRYPSPLVGHGIPFIIGPLAGSVPTPEGFAGEGIDRQWFRKLRAVDGIRLQHDPLLRRTYADAALVLGVAPYVQRLLSKIEIRRFSVAGETGVEQLSPAKAQSYEKGETLRLLFAGRLTRTKGITDAIRAVSLLPAELDVKFDIFGVGELESTCSELIKSLGLENSVTLRGRVPRDELDSWYQKAHVFLFPSFREPSGNVVFEALGHGLPVITCSNGGPGYVVDSSCGAQVDPTTPDQMAKDLAAAIVSLTADAANYARLSAGARARISGIALWENKITDLLVRYREVAAGSARN